MNGPTHEATNSLGHELRLSYKKKRSTQWRSSLTFIDRVHSIQTLQGMTFPGVRCTEQLNVRLKNVQHRVYLCVKSNGEDHSLSTKSLTSETDPELDFSLYFYTSAEAAENKMVLPVHQATRACLRMTLDGKLELTFLGETEEPMAFEKADSRFFYVRVVGTNYALEAMNGVNYDHYLALQEAGFDEYTIHFRENSGTDFPDDIQFQVDEMDA